MMQIAVVQVQTKRPGTTQLNSIIYLFLMFVPFPSVPNSPRYSERLVFLIPSPGEAAAPAAPDPAGEEFDSTLNAEMAVDNLRVLIDGVSAQGQPRRDLLVPV